MFSNYIKYGLRYSLRYILKYIIRVVIFFSIIYLISFLSGKHLFIADVHAEVISGGGYQDTQFMSCSGGACNIDYSWSNSAFANTGEGELVFNFGISATGSVNTAIPAINTMRVKTNQGQFACEYSSYSAPMIKFPNGEGNTTQSVSVSARCPVNFGPGGLTGVIIGLRSIVPNFEFRYYLGDIMTFSSNNQQVIADNTAKTKHSIDETNKTIKDTNNTIKDDNVDSSTNKGSSFFNDFDSGDEGSLTDIVSLPLEYVQHLNDTCQPFTIPTGKLGNITIPCLSSIWSSTSFAGIIKTASLIINGIICYKLLSSLFLFFKQLKDPDDDKVEVMNL